jgi:hypothetical protein
MVTKTKNARQAIILIHGIGEQRPMETALNFARSIAAENDIRQKPTPFGIQGETQRISIKENRYQPRTDIFEYYWAHRFRSNRLGTIKRWVIDVFLQCLFSGSAPGFFSKRLQFILASLAFFMMPLLYCLLAWLSYDYAGYHGLLIYAGTTYALYRIVLSDILYGYIADAAKYLSNHPDNISAREEVRTAGLRLLTDIVNTGKYDRVIIVGHSLGSVIGYDILSMAWARFVDGIEASEKDRSFIVRGFHELQAMSLNDPDSRLTQEFQKKQRLLRTRMAGSDVRWLVSDLVTLGSPLTSIACCLNARPMAILAIQPSRGRPPRGKNTHRTFRPITRCSYSRHGPTCSSGVIRSVVTCACCSETALWTWRLMAGYLDWRT